MEFDESDKNNIKLITNLLRSVISTSDQIQGGALGVTLQESSRKFIKTTLENSVYTAILKSYQFLLREENRTQEKIEHEIKKVSEEVTRAANATEQSNRNDETRRNEGRAQNKAVTNAINTSADKNAKDIANSLKNGLGESLRKLANGDVFGSLGTALSSFGTVLPKLNMLLSIITPALSYGYNVNKKNLEQFEMLNNSGVVMTKTYDELFDYASQIGITKDALVEGMAKYSQQVSQLGGMYKDSIKSFTTFMESNKKVAKELGMDYSIANEIAMKNFDDLSYSYLLQGKSLDEMTNETSKYIKSLQKMSLATGKSTKAINDEIEARNKDNLWKVLESDPRNKQKILAMTAAGFTQDHMEAALTGVMNESTNMAMTHSPAFGKLFNRVMNSSNDEKAEEIITSWQGSLTQSDREASRRGVKFLQDNPAFALGVRDTSIVPAIYAAESAMKMNLNEKTIQDYIDASGAKSTAQEELDRRKNAIDKFISLDAKNITIAYNYLPKIHTLLAWFLGGLTLMNFMSMFTDMKGLFKNGFSKFGKSINALSKSFPKATKFLKGAGAVGSAIGAGVDGYGAYKAYKEGDYRGASAKGTSAAIHATSAALLATGVGVPAAIGLEIANMFGAGEWLGGKIYDWTHGDKEKEKQKQLEQEEQEIANSPQQALIEALMEKLTPLIEKTHSLLDSISKEIYLSLQTMGHIEYATKDMWKIMYEKNLKSNFSLSSKIAEFFIDHDSMNKALSRENAILDRKLELQKQGVSDSEIDDIIQEEFPDEKGITIDYTHLWKIPMMLFNRMFGKRKESNDASFVREGQFQSYEPDDDYVQKITDIKELSKQMGISVDIVKGVLMETPIGGFAAKKLFDVISNTSLSEKLFNTDNSSNNSNKENVEGLLGNINSGIKSVKDSIGSLVSAVKEGNQIKKNSNFNNEIYAMS